MTWLKTSILFFLGTSESTKNRREDCGLIFAGRRSVSIFALNGCNHFHMTSDNQKSAIRNPQSAIKESAIRNRLRAFNWRRACVIQEWQE
jgi:hypothetical protein